MCYVCNTISFFTLCENFVYNDFKEPLNFIGIFYLFNFIQILVNGIAKKERWPYTETTCCVAKMHLVEGLHTRTPTIFRGTCICHE